MSSARPTEHDATNRQAFTAWLADFFADYYQRRPVNATFIGIHEYDQRLPDFSPEGMSDLAKSAASLRERLLALSQTGLTEAEQHDYRIADGYLQIQQWEATSAQFARNPAQWTGEAIFGIISLFQRDAEPQDVRVTSAIARMNAIPAFLAQGRAVVESAPVAWTERALREARAGVTYFGTGLAILAEDRGITNPDFLPAAEIAHTAFVEHTDWLEHVLLTSPSDDYASGSDAFERYLSLGHCLAPEKNAAWVLQYAEQEMAKAREALDAQAATIDPAKTWRELLPGLADFHPTAADYYGAYDRVWKEAKQSAIDHNLITWPDNPIVFEPFIRSDRDVQPSLYYLFYRCPAPFGRPETHVYRVTPVEPDMTPEEQERRLRATNDSVIKLNHIIHHGGLGHHVQNWHAPRADSAFGKMGGVDCASRVAIFGAGTMIEGWACYAVDLMDEVGFLTPLESLAEAQGRLRMVARAIADVKLHTGEWTLDETAAFYEQDGGMNATAAKGEAVKNSMFPGAAMMYLIGSDAIHDLRQTMSLRQGSDFSLSAFHDRFLSYGAIPVALIAESMITSI